MFTLRRLAFLVLSFLLAACVQAEVAVSKDGTYLLTDFGPTGTVQEAQATMDSAADWIVKHGGGLLIVPPTVTARLEIRNTYQQTRENEQVPVVTIVDHRNGFQAVHVPQVGEVVSHLWTGTAINRTLDMPQSLPHWGTQGVLALHNTVLRGSSSVLRRILEPVKKGKDVRIYPVTIRGIFPGQFLNVGPYTNRSEYVRIKSVGWDAEKTLPYCTADLQNDHGAGELLNNKNNVPAMSIVTSHNTDTQTFDFDVSRYQYSAGDTFVISGTYIYQGDVHTGLGDENGNVYNAEVEQDPDPFHGTVESVDWTTDTLAFRNGAQNVHKLATSRPIINMNRAKWITKGAVRIVPPEEWSGLMIANPKYTDAQGDFVKNGIDMKSFEMTFTKDGKPRASITTWDGKPIRALKYVYQGRAYPSLIYQAANYLGGRIIGSKDCGWTPDIVGRYFAVAQEGEYVTPADSGYKASPRRDTYRWYLIDEFTNNPDGTCTIRIERTRFATVRAGAPTLYNEDNYTWDGHERPLKYFIAPGAMAYDIAGGWQDASIRGGVGQGIGKIKTIAIAERGTALDFAPGDPIEQAIGADPYLPVAFRIREFNKVPSSWPNGAISLMQNGQVTTHAGVQFSGPITNRDDIAKRKDRKPVYENGLIFNTVMGAGIRFGADMQEAALLFEQPYHAQTLKWLHEGGATVLAVDPRTGDMSVTGGAVSLPAVKGLQGISATATAAKNLRGINVRVTTGAKKLQITFPIPEADANYAVHVQPTWFTQTRLTKKTAAGFTVEFNTAAPSGATVDWILVR
ncbi:MAG: ACT domain-containing protein [Armatimonadota bacterium]